MSEDTESPDRPGMNGDGMSCFERLIATASMLEVGVTIRLRGPRTPRDWVRPPTQPTFVAELLVEDSGDRLARRQWALVGFGESPLEAIESAASMDPVTGPYGVKP